jgi:phosphatidate cytidylyltransferase
MRKRIVSFLVLCLALWLSLTLFGVAAGVWIIALLTFLTQLELYQLFEKMGLKPMYRLGLACGLVISLGTYYAPGLESLDNPDAGNDLFLLSFLALTLTIIGRDLYAGRLRSFMPTLFGLIYVPFLLHFLIKLVKLAEITEPATGEGSAYGLFLAIWIVAVAKCTDIGGLLFGLRYGRRPLSPALSPRKTVEGAAGGIAVAATVGVLLPVSFPMYAPDRLSWWLAAITALVIAVASIASDLVESAFKRQAGVKDSGDLIPGIGGIFDLTDSLILSAPMGYLIFKYTLF